MIKPKVRIEDRDTGYRNLQKNFKGGAVDVGIFGEQGSEAVIIAATNEFGTDRAGPGRNIKIPQRSFLRGGVDEKKADIRDKINKGKDKMARGQLTVRNFLEGLGIYVADKIVVERINRSKEWAEPIKESTKKRRIKESDKPLVDTTENIKGRITHRVVK